MLDASSEASLTARPTAYYEYFGAPLTPPASHARFFDIISAAAICFDGIWYNTIAHHPSTPPDFTQTLEETLKKCKAWLALGPTSESNFYAIAADDGVFLGSPG